MRRRKTSRFKITDLFDLDELQRIQDTFSKSIGISVGISNIDGKEITRHASTTEFCYKYVKGSPAGKKLCEECDRMGMEMALGMEAGKVAVYTCHAGLLDFAAPIVVDGRPVCCFLGGQVLTEPLSAEKVRVLAEDLNIDPEELEEASEKIPLMDVERVKSSAELIYIFSNMLSRTAYDKYQIQKTSKEVEKIANMKSDFLANMSHEIRTPMNAVIGMAEMTLREELPPAARNYVNQIMSSGRTLLAIINDILDFSKIESGKMEIIPVEYEPISLINDVTNIIMTRIGSKEVELILDVSPNLPSRLYGDNIRIKQIVVNLCNNAVKFTERGKVVLRIGHIKKSKDQIEIQVSVEDTGIGIKKHDLAQLFQSFSQLDSKRNRNIEGTGLGLAISKQLLTLMNGHIDVESQYGKGSLFYFTLPQKIVDETPAVIVDSARMEELSVAGLVKNEHVSRQLEKDIGRMGAAYYELTSERHLDFVEKKEISFLFVEHALFSDYVQEFVTRHPEMTAVVMADYAAMIQYHIPNVRVVGKPLCSMNISRILRGDDILIQSKDYQDDFDFIAPEARILIVDDNSINLTVSEGLLKPLRMNIETASGGKEAVDKISAKKYDLILMDHMMPEIDGVETTHIIRRFHAEYDDVPIIALTANAVAGTKEMFIEEGMNDFIAKPIELPIICAKLKKWLPAEKIQKTDQVIARETAAASSVSEKDQEWCEELSAAGLDVSEALNLLGDTGLYFEVLKDYYQAINKKAQRIKELEEAEKWHDYTIEVHALKSSSRQIGAMKLSEQAARMEQAGNAEDAACIHEMTVPMLEEYYAVWDILKPLFESGKEAGEEKYMYAGLLQDCFIVMRSAMENLDMDQMDQVIQEMSKYRYGENEEELFEKLKEAVEELNVDACEDIMAKWERS